MRSRWNWNLEVLVLRGGENRSTRRKPLGARERTNIKRGSKVGAVVTALASHQCGPGSTPGVDAICGLSLLFVVENLPLIVLL